MFVLTFPILLLLSTAAAQHADDNPENHPKLTTWKCSREHGCTPQQTAIVMDSLKRPIYQVNATSLNCGSDRGSPPNTTVCPDVNTCQANCAMGGIEDYSTAGVSTDGGSLHLDMLRDDDLFKLSPRVYLLSENEESYEMLRLVGQELAFDVDASKLPCGMNGALYLSEMEETGGLSNVNTAGPAYGTGYCDAQCYITPFINGEANIDGYGACCNELDIWEANARATHLAPHPCNITGLYQCKDSDCTASGVCDKPGCAYNPYGVGNHDFYGLDKTVDTRRPFTVLTRFPTNAEGQVESIQRLYVQDGKVIHNAATNSTTLPSVNLLDDDYCKAAGTTAFTRLGATAGMGEAMDRGMVLCMSVWWDESGKNLSWLDQDRAGPCSTTEGSPAVIKQTQPDTRVTFSNIKWGEIGSTVKSCK